MSMRFSAFGHSDGKIETSTGSITFALPSKARVEIHKKGSDKLFLSDGEQIIEQTGDGKYEAQLADVMPDLGIHPISIVLADVPSAASIILFSMSIGQSPLENKYMQW